ncbi:MAG: hypothetical protein DI629_01110 [Mesorhizobium amorphae]|nr:MAG: hypothetical protein DI629_01110 [Mesorhizobium amorphae]
MDTLHNLELEPDLLDALRERAESHGVPVEQEVQQILRDAVQVPKRRRKLTEADWAALSIRPDEPFNLKAWSDEAWEEGLK